MRLSHAYYDTSLTTQKMKKHDIVVHHNFYPTHTSILSPDHIKNQGTIYYNLKLQGPIFMLCHGSQIYSNSRH